MDDYDPTYPVTTTTTTTTTTDAVNNNDASVENNNDENNTHEFHSSGGDNGLSFVGIDDMIVDDDDDDNDDSDKELANTAGHQKVNFGNKDGMTQDYLLTQPPDTVARDDHPHDNNGDALSLSSLLDEESASPSQQHPRPMPRRDLPRTSSPLLRGNIGMVDDAEEVVLESQLRRPSRPLRTSTRNRKVIVEQQRELDDVPIEINHTHQQQQRQRPKRGRRKPRESIQIPIHLRKAPPETLGLASTSALSLARTEEVEVKEKEGVYIHESQMPLPLMRNRKWQNADEKEEDDGDGEDNILYESQIPLMTRMTRKSGSSVHSSDEWMKVSKGKSVSSTATTSRTEVEPPKHTTKYDANVAASSAAASAASTNNESTTTDLFVESQIAGEGSDETFSPPSPMPSVSKSPLRKKLTSTTAAPATNQDNDKDNDHHRVRFAIDQTKTTIDDRDVSSQMILSKSGIILGLDDGPQSTLNSDERKRTASETFDITQFMDKVKRLCGQ